MTWFDVVVAAVAVTIAFSVGRSAQAEAVKAWFPPSDQVRAPHLETLHAKEALDLARLRLEKARDRVVEEEGELTVAEAKLPGVHGEDATKLRDAIDGHRVVIPALRERGAALVSEVATAEMAVERAQRREQRDADSRQRTKKWRDWGILAGMAFAMLVVLWLLLLTVRRSVHYRPVLAVSASALACLLLAAPFGWVAAAAALVAIAAIVVGRKPV